MDFNKIKIKYRLFACDLFVDKASKMYVSFDRIELFDISLYCILFVNMYQSLYNELFPNNNSKYFVYYCIN
jgi:hypothetical protein